MKLCAQTNQAFPRVSNRCLIRYHPHRHLTAPYASHYHTFTLMRALPTCLGTRPCACGSGISLLVPVPGHLSACASSYRGEAHVLASPVRIRAHACLRMSVLVPASPSRDCTISSLCRSCILSLGSDLVTRRISSRLSSRLSGSLGFPVPLGTLALLATLP